MDEAVCFVKWVLVGLVGPVYLSFVVSMVVSAGTRAYLLTRRQLGE